MSQAVNGECKGLDLGTSRLVLAEMAGEQPRYNVQLNAFISLPHSRMTESMLADESIHHRLDGEEILAFGNRVDEFANMLGGDTRRPMQTGLINPHEPRSTEMMTFALEKMCGQGRKGSKICYSIPSAPIGHDSELIFHEQVVAQALENLGYEAKAVNEGLAVIYAELRDANFTGIGVSFGGGLCNVCLAYLGLPVLTFCTERAGDYIDASAAKVTGTTPTSARLHKESGAFRLANGTATGLDQALSVYYRDSVQTMAKALEREFKASSRLPKSLRAVPLVYSGGTSLVKGFDAELKKALQRISIPLEITEVRAGQSKANTTAKGMLIAAMLNM